MSNRLFQGVVHQMRDAIDRTIGVIDESMAIIACSCLLYTSFLYLLFPLSPNGDYCNKKHGKGC